MNREQKLEVLADSIIEHYDEICSCDKTTDGFMCLANRFLTGNLSLEDTLDELNWGYERRNIWLN